jgi:hypothetical protein
LYLLKESASEVIVPPAVIREVNAQVDDATQQVNQATNTWLQVRSVSNTELLNLLLADLGEGEAEAIVLARELSADRAVLDDLDARRFARRIGLPLIGTVGLLLTARRQDKIPSLQAEIDHLRQAGFWTSEALVEAVLRSVDEWKD